MSRFYEAYEAIQKAASGGGRNANRSLGTGETLSPPRRDIGPTAVLRPVQAQEKNGTEWLRALRIVRKHWRISALFATVLTVTVIVVTFSMKPIYEPVARIEVDPPGEQFSLEGGISGNDSEYLETQSQNLKSDKLAMDVIRRLHLDQSPAMVAPGDSGSKAGDLAVYQLNPAEYCGAACVPR